MNAARTLAVARVELRFHLTRPLLLVLLLLLALTAYGNAAGNLHLRSSDGTIGGGRVFVSSQFAVARTLSLVVALFYTFFIAIAAGMAVIRDEELGVSPLLDATPLSPQEYAWGKFLGVVAAFAAVLAAHVSLLALFNHVTVVARSAELHGPFVASSYLVPAIAFGVPFMLFVAGASFGIGAWTRRPIVVFVLPLAMVLASVFLLWRWAPGWLDPRIDRALMAVDPSGYRWLERTWITEDRGRAFYNGTAIDFDVLFVSSRATFVLVGLACVAGVGRVVARRRTGRDGRHGRHGRHEAVEPAGALPPTPVRPLSSGARTGPGWATTLLSVAWVEWRELREQPGIYLFAPLVVIETLTTTLLAVGAFDTPLLLTSGTLAVRSMSALTLLLCPLLAFYTVESLERERLSRVAPLVDATGASSAAMLLGKVVAIGVVASMIVLATFASCLVALAVQGTVGLQLGPFVIVWGGLLAPTLVLVVAAVALAHTLTGSRYATYGLALAAMIVSGQRELGGRTSWLDNWSLWGVLRWSDMGPLQLDRSALVLNRLLVLACAALFFTLAVVARRRTEGDGAGAVLRPTARSLAAALLALVPLLAPPLAIGTLLYVRIQRGFQGDEAILAQRDYWRRNVATYTGWPTPAVTRAEVTLELDPAHSAFRVEGFYDLHNDLGTPVSRIPVSTGLRWRDVRFSLDGRPARPEDRAGLLVFRPDPALPPGGYLRLGFGYHGLLPDGISRNGGDATEFILPAGVVLTSVRPTVFPVMGYLDDVGVDADTSPERRAEPDDFPRGVTEAFVASRRAFDTRITIRGPAAYLYSSVGVMVREQVRDGTRECVWESDRPVPFWNVLAGRWDVRRGAGVAVYYHPGHAANVDEILATLEVARNRYSRWFRPYPWRELRLSEFPAVASYAQSFPTNIAFSEGIGFLTRGEPRASAAFVVTAHEAAHQWWGSLVTPGKGPGGDVLAEGLAHYSALRLLREVHGPYQRMELLKQLEKRYVEQRVVDAERPLREVDGSRPGDQTLIYDKGGWVFFMLEGRVGEEALLAGLGALVDAYRDGPDHPVLADLVEAMRPFADDPSKYDGFVSEWTARVVLPEFEVRDARRARAGAGGWKASATVTNVGTGRMPVVVAAANGERYDEGSDQPRPGYRERRVALELGPGDSRPVALQCDFEPDRIVVDPDVMILQAGRDRARALLR